MGTRIRENAPIMEDLIEVMNKIHDVLASGGRWSLLWIPILTRDGCRISGIKLGFFFPPDSPVLPPFQWEDPAEAALL